MYLSNLQTAASIAAAATAARLAGYPEGVTVSGMTAGGCRAFEGCAVREVEFVVSDADRRLLSRVVLRSNVRDGGPWEVLGVFGPDEAGKAAASAAFSAEWRRITPSA